MELESESELELESESVEENKLFRVSVNVLDAGAHVEVVMVSTKDLGSQRKELSHQAR